MQTTLASIESQEKIVNDTIDELKKMNQQQEKTIEDVNGIDDKMNRVYKLTKSCVFCSVRPKFGIGYGIG